MWFLCMCDNWYLIYASSKRHSPHLTSHMRDLSQEPSHTVYLAFLHYSMVLCSILSPSCGISLLGVIHTAGLGSCILGIAGWYERQWWIGNLISCSSLERVCVCRMFGGSGHVSCWFPFPNSLLGGSKKSLSTMTIMEGSSWDSILGKVKNDIQ